MAGDLFSSSRRLVIKIGSSLLIDKNGQLSAPRMRRLVGLVAKLHWKGCLVTVVSSGAVVASHHLFFQDVEAFQKVSRIKRPMSLPVKQARSAIGQVYLMEKYRRAFERKGLKVGQVLISKFSINHRTSYLNARNTLHELWGMGAIPIVNENDPLATEEFRFGENDILGALVCGLVDADLYVILSHVDGVYKNFPPKSGKKDIYRIIDDLSESFLSKFASKTSAYGSGGILAKLQAARLAKKFGVPTLIKNGNRENLYEHLLDDQCGTLIQSEDQEMQKKNRGVTGKKRWILSHGSPRGVIHIDNGAATALSKGKSLLPRGIVGCKGKWEEGDICEVMDDRGSIIARGLCNYSNQDLLRIKGQKTNSLPEILGRPSHAEVMHRDNLVWEGSVK